MLTFSVVRMLGPKIFPEAWPTLKILILCLKFQFPDPIMCVINYPLGFL